MDGGEREGLVKQWARRLETAYLDHNARAEPGRRIPLRPGDVQGAASLLAASDAPERLAANRVFVALSSDTASGSSGVQVVQREVLVVIALRDPSDRFGDDGLTDLERILEATTGALIGWRHKGAVGPARYLRGSLAAFQAKTIWWQTAFAVPVAARGN